MKTQFDYDLKGNMGQLRELRPFCVGFILTFNVKYVFYVRLMNQTFTTSIAEMMNTASDTPAPAVLLVHYHDWYLPYREDLIY